MHRYRSEHVCFAHTLNTRTPGKSYIRLFSKVSPGDLTSRHCHTHHLQGTHGVISASADHGQGHLTVSLCPANLKPICIWIIFSEVAKTPEGLAQKN